VHAPGPHGRRSAPIPQGLLRFGRPVWRPWAWGVWSSPSYSLVDGRRPTHPGSPGGSPGDQPAGLPSPDRSDGTTPTRESATGHRARGSAPGPTLGEKQRIGCGRAGPVPPVAASGDRRADPHGPTTVPRCIGMFRAGPGSIFAHPSTAPPGVFPVLVPVVLPSGTAVRRRQALHRPADRHHSAFTSNGRLRICAHAARRLRPTAKALTSEAKDLDSTWETTGQQPTAASFGRQRCRRTTVKRKTKNQGNHRVFQAAPRKTCKGPGHVFPCGSGGIGRPSTRSPEGRQLGLRQRKKNRKKPPEARPATTSPRQKGSAGFFLVSVVRWGLLLRCRGGASGRPMRGSWRGHKQFVTGAPGPPH